MTMKDLNADIKMLRDELDQQSESSRHGDQNRSKVIYELTKQNERLSEELRHVSNTRIIMKKACTLNNHN